jgi:hypothetical protein
MKTKFGLFSLLSKFGKCKRASSRRLLLRLLRDEAGSYLLYMTLLMPVLIGIAGLGTEGSLMLYNHRSLQDAADSAAISAAKYYAATISSTRPELLAQAETIAAKYGFINGTNGVTVNVIGPSPPPAGYTTNQNAIEVIITQPEQPLLSKIWLKTAVNITASAVAVAPNQQCVLALGINPSTGLPTAPQAISLNVVAGIDLGCGLFSNSNCANCGCCFDFFLRFNSIEVVLGSITATSVGTVGGVLDVLGSITTPNTPKYSTNVAPIPDPYANVIPPSPGTCKSGPNTNTITTNQTISPGTYCGTVNWGPAFGSRITVQMNPGVYIFNLDNSGSSPGTLNIRNANLTDNGGGVTMVFTGSCASNNCMSAINSSVTLTAPAPGSSTAGLVMFGKQTMPFGSYNFDLNSSLNATGTVYLPRGNLTFALIAGSVNTSCTHIIVNTISFTLGAGIYDNCDSYGTLPITSPTLVY